MMYFCRISREAAAEVSGMYGENRVALIPIRDGPYYINLTASEIEELNKIEIYPVII